MSADRFQLVPPELRALPRWVVWRLEPREGQVKDAKVPVNPRNGSRASTRTREDWTDFETAVSAFACDGRLEGIGFVFVAEDGFVGIDLDDCLGEDGQLVDAARAIVDDLDSYTEISPSGHGVKVFARGAKPDWSGCRSKAVAGFKETEIYDSGRFFCVTGNHLPGAPQRVNRRQPQLERLCARLWPPATKAAIRRPTDGALIADDEDLLSKARGARNGKSFDRLWNGDASMHGGDKSSADLALCSHLAFWTGRDPAWIDRLFRRSGLMREKWDERRGGTTYGEMTIAKAVEGCTECHGEGRPAARPGEPPDEPGARVFLQAEIDALLGNRDDVTRKLVLSPQRTVFAAEAYVREFHRHPEGRTLVGRGEELLEWRDNRYVPVAPETISQRLQLWLHDALQPKAMNGGFVLVPFACRPNTVTAVLQSILWYVQLPARTAAPVWIDERTDRFSASELLPCRTVNVHGPTGTVVPATPALFVRTALSFDYDPAVPPPARWLQFLEELLGDDRQAIDLLQDWFGYCLLRDTSLQKAFLLVGPRRSGKGTIARTLTKLLGPENVAAPTAASLSGNFGLQPVADKSLAIVSDARIGASHSTSLIERVLCITGEDSIVVDRKYRDPETVRLPARVMIVSNELPQLADTSGAVAGRFVILQLTRSFFDREDPTLEGQLAEELPGILLWALEGLRRLRERGRFVQPASSKDAMHELEDLSSPLSAFARDECTIAPGRRATADELFAAWRRWCAGMSIEPGSKATLGRAIRAAFPFIKRRRGTEPFYDGIALGGEDA